MANIDRNFIATPSFVVKNDGGGQTITMQLRATGTTSSGTFTQSGWAKVSFNTASLMAVASVSYNNMPYNVTPSVANGSELDFSTDPSTDADRLARVYNFLEFVHENPVHVKAINLRTSNEVVLPQQIIIKTPNIFTGQLDRQIIDVASKKTAYQYQNGIITIADTDLYLCRTSIIEFVGSFSLVGAAETGASPLYMDLVIDTYLSLEKGLVENVTLLNTASGLAVAAVEAEQNLTAVVNPETLNNEALQRVSETSYIARNGNTAMSAVEWVQNKMRTR